MKRNFVYIVTEATFLFVNGVKLHQFKAKDSELFAYPLCLGNIEKSFQSQI